MIFQKTDQETMMQWWTYHLPKCSPEDACLSMERNISGFTLLYNPFFQQNKNT